jgi:hypothetical protein
MSGTEKVDGLATSAIYSLSRNDLLGNILYNGCSASELLTLAIDCRITPGFFISP